MSGLFLILRIYKPFFHFFIYFMEDCWCKSPLIFLFIEMVLVVVTKSWPKILYGESWNKILEIKWLKIWKS